MTHRRSLQRQLIRAIGAGHGAIQATADMGLIVQAAGTKFSIAQTRRPIRRNQGLIATTTGVHDAIRSAWRRWNRKLRLLLFWLSRAGRSQVS
jgi:hypothetical protein